MNEKSVDKTRRRLVKFGATGLAAIPLGRPLLGGLAHAQDKLEEDNPQAQALAYSHDGSTATAANQNCANCQLYTGEASAEWGPCSIFPGKQVSAKGWCSAWVAKTG